MARTDLQTPLGRLYIDASAQGVRSASFLPHHADGLNKDESERARELAQETKRQVNEYFHGERTDFELPLDVEGTEFRQRVWGAIAEIPAGTTISYAQLAAEAGAPGASRAAGAACGANQVILLIPCHRVIGSDGGLHGFGAGLDRKAWLLRHEGFLPANSPLPGIFEPVETREPVSV